MIDFNRKELEYIFTQVDPYYNRGSIAIDIRQHIIEELKDSNLHYYEFSVKGETPRLKGSFRTTIEEINNIVGKEILFFNNTLDPNKIIKIKKEHFTLVETDLRKVLTLEEYGINPFNYWTCEGCGWEINPITCECVACESLLKGIDV